MMYSPSFLRFFCVVVFLFWLAPIVAQTPLEEGVKFSNRQQHAHATKQFQLALVRDSSHLETWVRLIGSLIQEGKDEQAVKTAQKAIEKIGPDASVIWLKGECEMRLQFYTAAFQTLKPLLKRQTPATLVSYSHEDLLARLESSGQLAYRDLVDAGNWKAGREIIREVVQLQPNNLISQKALVYASVQLNDWQTVLKDAQHASKKFPNDNDLLRMEVLAYQQLGQLQEAQKSLQILYSQDPKDLSLGALYAQVLAQSSQFDAAQNVLYNLIEAHPQEKELYFIQANIFGAKGADTLREQVWVEIHNRFPTDTMAAEHMRLYLINAQRCAAGIAWCDSLAKRTNKVVYYGLLKAAGWLQCESDSMVRNTFEELLIAHPKEPHVALSYGNYLMGLNAFEAAWEMLNSAASHNDNPELKAQLGSAAFEVNKKAQAYVLLEALANEHPDYLDYRARFALAQMVQKEQPRRAFALYLTTFTQLAKNLQDAQELLFGTLQGAPDGWSVNRFQVNDFQTQSNFFTSLFEKLPALLPANEVRQIWDTLLLLYPNSSGVMLFIGNYEFDKMQWDVAQDLYTKAVARNPKLYEGHMRLGLIYERKQVYLEATKAFERARGLQPKDPKPYEGLIRLATAQGQMEALANRWQRELQTQPNNENLRSHLKAVYHKLNAFEKAKALDN